jgi:hypothetical protein
MIIDVLLIMLGQHEGVDDIINDDVPHWKSDNKYRFLVC